MSGRATKHLEDIRDGADFIVEVTRGRTLDDYLRDRLLRQAVEPGFEIIGEAMTRMRRDDRETADGIPHSSQIVAFRNLLIHGYDLIREKKVWETIQNDVPKLAGSRGAVAWARS